MNRPGKITTLLVLLSYINSGFAVQQKTVNDRDMITISVSSKDPNIITAANDRITKYKYAAVKGVAKASFDSKDGILNINPTGVFNDKPFSMIVFTEKGYRYTLLLVPKKIPAQDIILNNERSIAFEKTVIADNSAKIANLVKAMIKDDEITGYKKQTIEADVDENKQDLNHVVNYVGNEFTGEIAIYTNLTNANVTLQEQAFYGDKVMAVAISDTNLKPSEITKVYRVVKNG